ncbi:hypothetical protein [Euzebyella saccharophila]|uniref:Uncharacterized protein n=1 Tax=Euzebyella saccharophila TaxID=679664 RepID=A0ABV8JV67_9FLAO|nr:hypothetical protein [Euzebyella saccharophila]
MGTSVTLAPAGVNAVKLNDGSTLNLEDIDLSEMDWITKWNY